MLRSINPYSGQEFHRFEELSEKEIDTALERAVNTFKKWKKTDFEERSGLLKNAASILRERKQEYGEIMTREMGKPITQSIAEIEKCAWACEYYAENAEDFLKNEIIPTAAHKSFVRHDPLGVVVAIMPWNYPFWQVIRFAAPSLMAGNVGILKHSSNVSRCALKLEQVFYDAGFPKGAFQAILADNEQTKAVLEHPKVAAATLTGSERAGSSVASTCGAVIKKTVLELGGSNAMIVFEDADLQKTAEIAVNARFMNAGQSCIAAKRFIVLDSVYEEFIHLFKKMAEKFQIGDPTNPDTLIASMARLDLAEKLEEQMNKSVEMGAEIFWGGKREEAKFHPTILTNVKEGMPAFEEETFGPLAAFIRVKDEDEAIKIANSTKFGLGVMIFSQNIKRAEELAWYFDDGAVFINELVKSDPRLPFGGTKISGYGRELSKDGIMEFINRKTVYINQL